CGPGGIGKTALAAETVWRLAPNNAPPIRFPDGIIFHSFYGQPQIDLALEKIVIACGDEPIPTPLAAAQRVLSKRQALLLLDGAEEADNLLLLLQIRGNCGVLVTSRKRRDALTTRHDVLPLSISHAIELLQKWGGVWATDKIAVKTICEQVGGWPLAVRLVGRYLQEAEETAVEYLAWLEETPIGAMSMGERQAENVDILLARSLAQVDATARRLLGIVGQLALPPVTAVSVSSAVRLPIGELKQAWRQLLGYGLLQKQGAAYKVTHPLIHTYASRRLKPTDEEFERLASYYTNLVLAKREQGVVGYRLLTNEREHLMRLLTSCMARKQWNQAIGLVRAMEDYLDLQGHLTDRRIALEQGIIASKQAENKVSFAYFVGILGLNCRALGKVEEAIGYYEQALTISRAINDRRGEGNHLGNLGVAYSVLGQVEQAIGFYEQALAISRDIGDQQGEGRRLGGLGNIYRALGQTKKAIRHYEQALAIARETGHQRAEGIRLGNLGNAYCNLGNTVKAMKYYEQALAIAHRIGDRRGKGSRLGNLGNVYCLLGEVEKAIEYYKQSLVIACETNHRHGEGIRLGNLGNAYRLLGDIEKAIKYTEKALIIAREIRHQRGEGIRLGNLANAYRQLGHLEKARKYALEGLDIAHQIKEPPSEAWRLWDFARVNHALGQVNVAKQQARQAIDIFRALHLPQAFQVRQYLNDFETDIIDVPTVSQLGQLEQT
ncbi:MAG: tetratricopeptide repeat protein, partial [Chloroflexota bacterium]